MKSSTGLIEWLKSGKHLPCFMRDFHDQKSVFKFFDEMVQLKKERNPNDPIAQDLPNWISAQIYTIDFFLWTMAKFGYTLQKSRAPIEFFDIEKTLVSYNNEKLQQIADELKSLDRSK
jgi:hypothetical protein